ncbi:hypothetical protein, partial [Microbulbifer rhizosphaerae]|uniref:hypothetical protein n=1 Tax=Microbulbifer rhizosphaerae TaxID=1562603 RepID=UPI001C842CB9
MRKTLNKHIKKRPQKTWAGLAVARLLCGRYGGLFVKEKSKIYGVKCCASSQQFGIKASAN